jgi:hypothetical protein
MGPLSTIYTNVPLSTIYTNVMSVVCPIVIFWVYQKYFEKPRGQPDSTAPAAHPPELIP